MARESATDDIGATRLTSELSHVTVDGDCRPVSAQDGSTVRLDLAERDGTEPGSFESKAKSADSAEEIEDIHFAVVVPSVVPPIRRTHPTQF